MNATAAPRLLVVDDEAALVQALCKSLNDHGYDAVGRSDPTEALALLRHEHFQAILADLAMPGMGGIALLDAALEIDPFLVGVIMTGEGTIATAIQALQSGAVDYILKPFKLGAIRAVIDRALALRELRVRNAELEAREVARAAELEARNRDLEAFAYSAAHDLRGPLHVIGGFTQLLEARLPAPIPDEARVLLQHVLEGVEHMRQLVDGLMRLSRLSQLPLKLEEVDLGRLVGEVVRGLQAQVAPARLNVEVVARLPVARADAALVRQLFANLLSNAHKFSRLKAAPRVEVGVESDGVFFVCDNGCGFDTAQADRLFKPFGRLHGQSEFEGSGIGLSIAQRIVQRHGGHIWAEAKVGEGACFRFTLGPES